MDPLEQYVKANKADSADALAAYVSKNKPSDSSSSEKPGAAQAALESFGNAATLGYLPQMQAAVGRLIDGPLNPGMKVDSELTKQGFKISGPPSGYIQDRDENIRRHEQQRADFPKATAAGTVLGTIGGGLMVPAGAIAKGGTIAARAGRAALLGGGMGAAQNPGDVEGEFSLMPRERAESAAKGFAIGGAVQGGAEGIGLAAKKISDAAKGLAETKAFKATGAMLRDFRKAFGKDKVNEIGRQALDEGVVTGLSTPAKVAERAAAGMETKGKEIETILTQLEDAQKGMNNSGAQGLVPSGLKAPGRVRSGIDRKAIAKSMREDLLNSNTDISGVAAKNKKMERLISEFENGGNDLIGVLEGELKKRATGKEINWDRLPGADIPIVEQVQRSLYTRLKQGVEDSADALEKATHGPGSNRFIAAKDSFGNLSTINKIAKDRVNRDAANRAFGLTDTIMGAGGATAGFASGDSIEDKLQRAAIGLSMGGANKLARTYGNSVMAKGFDSVAKGLAKIPAVTALAEQNPAKFQALANRVASAVQDSPKFYRMDDDPILKDQKLMEYFQQSPGLIDNVEDPKRRALIKAKLRIPAAK